MQRLHSGAAVDRPEVTHLTLPPIPEFVWQQLQETHIINIHKVLTTYTHKNTQIPKFIQKNDVEQQLQKGGKGISSGSTGVEFVTDGARHRTKISVVTYQQFLDPTPIRTIDQKEHPKWQLSNPSGK